jgi:hypothetical protein
VTNPDEATPDHRCRICTTTKTTHRNATCPTCLHEVRTNLKAIGTLCDALPAEAEHRGINSQAMALLAPAADPEARSHLEDSVLAGRIPADYLDYPQPGDKHHPAFIVGNWDMLVRGCLEHDRPEHQTTCTDPDCPGCKPWTLTSSIAYLDQQLTYLAAYDALEFPDLATDLEECVHHLEQVLHDGDQRDTGAPCLDCGVPLRREWGKLATADGWRCPRCKAWRNDTEYRLNVAHLHRENAEWLTDRDMEIRTGIKRGTIREWARRGDVKKRRDSGRTLYHVSDVLTRGGVAS